MQLGVMKEVNRKSFRIIHPLCTVPNREGRYPELVQHYLIYMGGFDTEQKEGEGGSQHGKTGIR